jgi:hypothetical protein
MNPLFNHTPTVTTKTRLVSKIMFLACSLFLVASVFGSTTDESNKALHLLADAQLENTAKQRGEVREVEINEELQLELDQQNQRDRSAPPNGISMKLDTAHFIPLSPLSDSPGNQVKMVLDYNIEESSPILNDNASAVMEVYSAANQTLLRTSSLPEPIPLDDSKGTIQLATTINDPSLKDVITKAFLTDGEKVNPITEPLETMISLGDVKTTTTATSEEQ